MYHFTFLHFFNIHPILFELYCLQIMQNHSRFNSFSTYYLMLALLSRGYVVRDQIDESFINAVISKSEENLKAANRALE